jgi:hypothetical protein
MVRKSLILFVLIMVLALSSAHPAFARTQGEKPASVYVVHGIPGKDLNLDPALPVDISVGEACALQGFTFGEIAGPVALPAGSYNIAIRLANAGTPCANAPVLQGTFHFAAGENASVVAHLTAAGAPTAAKFPIDFSKFYASRLRVIAHHTAAAPAVDIRFIRQELVEDRLSARRLRNVSNGMSGSVVMRPGTWNITLAPVADPRTRIGPITLNLEANTVYLAYAVGSLQSGTFTLLTKAIPMGARK